MLKIGYVVRGPGISGGQRVIHEHLERLKARGHNTAMVCLMEDPPPHWLEASYPVVGTDWVSDADVVVATSWPTAYQVLSMSTPAKKFYLVQGREFHMLGDVDPRRASEAEFTYKLPLNLITIAPWLAEMLRTEYEREVALIRNGVNMEQFHPTIHAPDRGTGNVLLVEGSAHSAAKDYGLMAVEVLHRMRTTSQLSELDLTIWVFTHDERYRDALAEYADKMFFRPEQDEIAPMYTGADAMLKCSRFEGSPCPIVEAMACGCVPIVAQFTGTHDVEAAIGPNFVMPYGDIDGAASAIRALFWSSSTALNDIKNQMRAYVEDHLQWEPVIDDLERIFTETEQDAPAWQQAQEAEALWWKGYIEQELGNPPFSTYLGQRQQQLKDALRKFGFWRDQNYAAITPGKWLDVGSGPVSMLHGLNSGVEVTAIDPLMEVYARELATVCSLGKRDNVTYQAGKDVEGEFEGVWCHNVLDHTADWRMTLGAMCEAVKAGGCLFLMTHCRPPYRLDRHHIQAFSPAEILNFLIERGFGFEYTATELQTGTNLTELYVIARKVGA